jgi:hypothetical protein
MSVFVLKGSSLQISDLRIDLLNESASSLTIKMGYDVFPLWLSVAVDAARKAENIAKQLEAVWDGSGDRHIVSLLEQEICASMQCIVAVAAAIDGFYGSAISRAPIESAASSNKRKRGRHHFILSYFQQKFVLRKELKDSLEKPLRDIFEFRHAALHSHGKPEEIAFHPRHKVSMPRKVAIFRYENAIEATSIALRIVSYLSVCPKPKFAALAEHCHISRGWVVPIVADWLSDHEFGEPNNDWLTFGPTRSMFERKGLLPHWRSHGVKAK